MVHSVGPFPAEKTKTPCLHTRLSQRRQQGWAQVERNGHTAQQPCSCKRLKLDTACRAGLSQSSTSSCRTSRPKTAAAATEAPPASEPPTRGRGRTKRQPGPDDVAPGLPVVGNLDSTCCTITAWPCSAEASCRIGTDTYATVHLHQSNVTRTGADSCIPPQHESTRQRWHAVLCSRGSISRR